MGAKEYIDNKFSVLRGMLDEVVSIGKLSRSNDGGSMQSGQVAISDFDAADDVEIFQQYGFTSRPPDGARGIVLRLGGLQVGFAFGTSSRPTELADGESQFYSTTGGQKMHLLEDGSIEIKQAEGGATVVIDPNGQVSITKPDGQKILLGGTPATLGVARLTDKTASDATMTAWVTAVTTAVTTMAALFNTAGPMVGAPGTITTIPIAPSDFGVISSASSDVNSQ